MALKDDLLKKDRPAVMFPIQIKDPSKIQLTIADLEKQKRILILAKKDTSVVDKKIANANRQLKKCFREIRLLSLEPAEYEKLVYENPPTVEQVKGKSIEDVPLWDDSTFQPALIAATAVDAGMTAEEWSETIKSSFTAGEFRMLWAAVLGINNLPRQISAALPKG